MTQTQLAQPSDSIREATALAVQGAETFSTVALSSLAWLERYPALAATAGLALLAGLAWLAMLAVRRYALRIVSAFTRRSASTWDEVLIEHGVFHRVTWAVPLILVHQGLRFVPHLPAGPEGLLQRLTAASILLVAVRAFSALLTAANEIYLRFPMAKDRPIKGLLQVASVIAHFAAAILIVATLMDRSPLIFISGLGAMTAILLLVFRDTILSLVAGTQLISNNLIRVGDWIEMPQFGADGDVVDIALNSVRVQNWDRTFTSIPTHKFLEHSFKNWRGMQEAGGRRIKRAFHVDMSTIRFLTEEEIERFGRFALLRDYVARKQAELEEHNRAHAAEPGIVANARRLTNVGTLRAYITSYLRQHPMVHQDMTFLVRQLQPTPEGLPIEIYVFSRSTAWAAYEGIQADIFDHVLSMVPEFGLRVYQKPSGHDVAAGLRERVLQPA